MKRLLPLFASVVLFPTSLVAPPVIAAETEIIALEIEPEFRENVRSISVKITSNSQGGSGVIIGKQNGQYLVITNNHVVSEAENFAIETADGTSHPANLVSNPITSDDDIALLTFNSDNSYRIAQLNSAATGKEEQEILAVGYAAETGEFTVEPGKIDKIPNEPFKEGYQIGYTSNVVAGMSGGAIFNTFGDLIGINGISAFPILNTAYEYQDGTKPAPEEIEQLRQLSWGLSLHRLLTQVNPEIMTAYNLPLPETGANLGTTELTGWVADLEATAKQITVRIDSSSGANGSGIIVSQEGNSYAVLTANHVICEQDDETNDCIGYTYEIVTPDGQKYPLDNGSVQRQEGVDLAVVRFTSQENYQVAKLANYPVKDDDAIFVAGYPQLSNNSVPQWKFSPGFGLEKERGFLNTSHNLNNNSLSQDSTGTESSQESLSGGGYEMVYTSITYGGMSGGAVLDRDGRVIGIHGAAEGETAFDSQSSSSKKIHLGYSLGIPIDTFIGLADQFQINSTLPIQDSLPRELNPEETEVFETAILGTEIPQGNATAERWLERGNQLWRLKRYEEAVKAFERAIALNPEFIHLAYHGKGLALRDGEKYEAALDSFGLATSTEPNFAPAFVEKSKVLGNGFFRWDEALVAINQAISLEKGNAQYYFIKGVILKLLGRYSEAQEALSQAIELNPRASLYLYYHRGSVYAGQGELELAAADYSKVIELNPQFVDAYNYRGNLYQKQGELELAAADYSKVIELNPQSADAYYRRGNLYSEQGKLDLATADYTQVIELNPQSADAYYRRGDFYVKQGKLDLAAADFNQAIEVDPQSADAYYRRGNFYSEQGKLDLAAADFNQAIEIYSQYAKAYISRGNLYSDQGKLDLAAADYSKAIEFNPQDAQAYYNRGLLYQNQGKLELAAADYNKAIEFNPQYAKAYNNRGILYSNQGKLELAEADYSKVIELNPQNISAYMVRGILYSDQGKLELAEADYSQAIELNPQYALAYISRGFVYFNQGKLDLAEADFTQAIELNPQSEDAYIGRGFVSHRLKKYNNALEDYQQALSIDNNNFVSTNNIGLIKYEMGAIVEAKQKFQQALAIDQQSAEVQLALAVTEYISGNRETALQLAKTALELDARFADSEFLKENLWGEQIIADTEKLLSSPTLSLFKE